MSVVYNGIHSVTFIESSQSITAGQTLTSFTSVRNTWNSFHLVPANRPYVSPMEPKIQLVTDTVSSKVFDITDAVAGGMTYSARKGSWDFLVDHDKWSNWYTAKQTIEDYLNGKRRYCFLNGDDTLLYCGRFKVSGWEDGTQYSKITIEYDLDYETYALSANLNRPTSLSVSWKSSAPTVYEHQKKDDIRDYLNATVSYGGYYTGSCDIDVIEGSFSGTGSQTVTITYTGNDLNTFQSVKLTTSISINVSEDYLQSISAVIDQSAVFFIGDTKDSIRRYLTIVAIYATGVSAIVSGMDASSLSGTFTQIGNNSLTIMYAGKSTNVSINILDRISFISARFYGENHLFYIGDSKNDVLDYVNLTVVYASGATSSVSGTKAVPITGKFETSGTQNVQINYQNFTTSITVNVEKTAIRITASIEPNSPSAYITDNIYSYLLRRTIVTLIYDDEHTEDTYIDMDNKLSFTPNDDSSKSATSEGMRYFTIYYLNRLSTNISFMVYNVISLTFVSKHSSNLYALVGMDGNDANYLVNYNYDIYYVLSNNETILADSLSLIYDHTLFDSAGNKRIHYSYLNDTASYDLTINVRSDISITSIIATNDNNSIARVGLPKFGYLASLNYTIYYSDNTSQHANEDIFLKGVIQTLDRYESARAFTTRGIQTINMIYMGFYQFDITVDVRIDFE